MRFVRAVVVSIVVVLVSTVPAAADVVVPPGFSIDPVTDQITRPTDVAFSPDGRLFVAEQDGRVRIVQADGSLVTFLDISSKVDASGERGLSGIAFDPGFASNGHVFLDYTKEATSTVPAHNRVVRVTANGDAAVPGNERLIFRLSNQDSTHHVGGALTFGDDGKLYVTTGDGLGGKSHLKSNLVGKVLRINKDGTIPASNPYYGSLTGKRRAIWALGLRNPFKIVDDPGGTSMYTNDVGADAWEEIDAVVARANFGWNLYEGPESDPAYADPIFAYEHDGDPATTGCAITGSAFSRGSVFPASYAGDYFFADLCNGWIRIYDPGTDAASDFLTGGGLIVDLGFGPDGRLYVARRGAPAAIIAIDFAAP